VQLAAASALGKPDSRKGGEQLIPQYRINERITAREVRVIDETGQQIGIMPLHRALQLARERGLDLVEVAPQAVPPVCRLMDYGKFIYQQAKREKESKRQHKASELKEVRLRPNIDEHDLDFKTKQIEEFLDEGNKVKVTVFFRGRTILHPELGQRVLNAVAERLRGKAVVEKPSTAEGRTLVMVLSPAPRKAPARPRTEQVEAATKES
jgi:translation initiation factor IF-3